MFRLLPFKDASAVDELDWLGRGDDGGGWKADELATAPPNAIDDGPLKRGAGDGSVTDRMGASTAAANEVGCITHAFVIARQYGLLVPDH
jgi:hypothetical protein